MGFLSWEKRWFGFFPPMGIPDPRGPAELGRRISKTTMRSTMTKKGKMPNMLEKAKRVQANFKRNKKFGDVINFYGFFIFLCVSVIWRTQWLYFFRLVNQKLRCLHLNGGTCSHIFLQTWRFTSGGGCFGCEGERRQDITKKLFVRLRNNIEESTLQYSNHFFLSCFQLGLLTSL